MSHVTGEALPFSFYGVHRICYILTVGLAMTGTILLDSVRYRKYSARSSFAFQKANISFYSQVIYNQKQNADQKKL